MNRRSAPGRRGGLSGGLWVGIIELAVVLAVGVTGLAVAALVLWLL